MNWVISTLVFAAFLVFGAMYVVSRHDARRYRKWLDEGRERFMKERAEWLAKQHCLPCPYKRGRMAWGRNL